MARNGLPGFERQTYAYNLLAHALVAFGGYCLFGGLKLFRAGRAVGHRARSRRTRRWIVRAPPLDHDRRSSRR